SFCPAWVAGAASVSGDGGASNGTASIDAIAAATIPRLQRSRAIRCLSSITVRTRAATTSACGTLYTHKLDRPIQAGRCNDSIRVGRSMQDLAVGNWSLSRQVFAYAGDYFALPAPSSA